MATDRESMLEMMMQQPQTAVDPIQQLLGQIGIYPYAKRAFIAGATPYPIIINNKAYELPKGLDRESALRLLESLFGQLEMKQQGGYDLPMMSADAAGLLSFGQMYSPEVRAAAEWATKKR